MSETSTALSAPEVKKSIIEISGGSIQLKTLDEMYRWAQYVIDSELAPKAYKKPTAVIVAVQLGIELGFPGPMTSLKAIDVIEGIPTLKGQAAMALCWSKGVFKEVEPLHYSGEGDEYKVTFVAWRKGNAQPLVTEYSITDARKAKLLGKQNWEKSPKEMLGWRAIGKWMKLYASDVTLGMPLFEEAIDYDIQPLKPSAPELKPGDAAPLEFADAIIVEEVTTPVTSSAAQPIETEVVKDDGFDAASAHAGILKEARERVGEDSSAVNDFVREVTLGGIGKIVSLKLAMEAYERMRTHIHFGDVK